MDLPEIDSSLTQVYECRRINRPLELTGKLDDPLWQSAQTAELVDVVSGLSVPLKTEVRLLYNKATLYLGFSCEDDYVWGTLRKRDSKIFDEECVEAFLCPSGKLRQYYEINVSPLNTVFDAIVLNARSTCGTSRDFKTLPAYHCEGLVTKTFVDGELGVKGARGWSAEYAIPFSSIAGHDNISPEPGDEWRMNLYRIDAPTPDNQVLYAWAPTGKPDFHLPWYFGRLVFV